MIRILNYRGHHRYPREYILNDRIPWYEPIFKHTRYYNETTQKFITIDISLDIEDVRFDSTHKITKFPEDNEFASLVIQSSHKSNKTCCVCLDNNFGINMPCCNQKQFVCSSCLYELYIMDTYYCPICRQLYVQQLMKLPHIIKLKEIFKNLDNIMLNIKNKSIPISKSKIKYILYLEKLLRKEIVDYKCSHLHKFKIVTIQLIRHYYEPRIYKTFISIEYYELCEFVDTIIIYFIGYEISKSSIYFTKIVKKNSYKQINNISGNKIVFIKE